MKQNVLLTSKQRWFSKSETNQIYNEKSFLIVSVLEGGEGCLGMSWNKSANSHLPGIKGSAVFVLKSSATAYFFLNVFLVFL